MKILVTGGLGTVGLPLVQRLLRNGHKVKVLDLQTEKSIEGAECIVCDIADFTTLREQMHGQDVVIHLAALPHPSSGPGQEIFRVNCSGTFNVYEAAAAEGIQRVVCASSINALGFSFGIKKFAVQYLPIDDAHPSFTTDPYSFSKQIVEEIGAYYWRREGISGICLRLPWLVPLSDTEWRQNTVQFLEHYHQRLGEFLSMPPDEQRDRIHTIHQRYAEVRTLRLMEKPQDGNIHSFFAEDPYMILLAGYSDFWSFITAETAAQAFEKSILSDCEGCHSLYVCERQNLVGIEAEKLAQLFFPGVPHKRPLVEKEPLVSSEKACQLIGFEPEMDIGEFAPFFS